MQNIGIIAAPGQKSLQLQEMISLADAMLNSFNVLVAEHHWQKVLDKSPQLARKIITFVHVKFKCFRHKMQLILQHLSEKAEKDFCFTTGVYRYV